jgi:hypothetical protein
MTAAIGDRTGESEIFNMLTAQKVVANPIICHFEEPKATRNLCLRFLASLEMTVLLRLLKKLLNMKIWASANKMRGTSPRATFYKPASRVRVPSPGYTIFVARVLVPRLDAAKIVARVRVPRSDTAKFVARGLVPRSDNGVVSS